MILGPFGVSRRRAYVVHRAIVTRLGCVKLILVKPRSGKARNELAQSDRGPPLMRGPSVLIQFRTCDRWSQAASSRSAGFTSSAGTALARLEWLRVREEIEMKGSRRIMLKNAAIVAGLAAAPGRAPRATKAKATKQAMHYQEQPKDGQNCATAFNSSPARSRARAARARSWRGPSARTVGVPSTSRKPEPLSSPPGCAALTPRELCEEKPGQARALARREKCPCSDRGSGEIPIRDK